MMRWKSPVALIASVAVAAVLAASAEGATKKRPAGQQIQSGPVQRTVYTSRDENGRRRTQIIVQRRSYLDPGTTVLPGQRKYSDYATQPFRYPFDSLGPGRGGFERNPIGPRWELGGAGY
jgi:hypothetical protein